MRSSSSSCLLSPFNSRYRGVACSLALVVLSLGAEIAAQENNSLAPEIGSGQPAAATVQKPKFPKKYDIERIGDRGVGDGVNFYSVKKERAMGEAMSRSLESRLQLLGDPELNAYVNRVVQNLVMNSDAKVPFTVKVVKSDQANAFSLPGGFLYVTSGLIAAAPDEATLAGILAHEVAHVAARHATRALTRRMILRMGSVPLMFLSGGAAAAINNAAGLAIPMSGMKFTRDSEREADLLGLEYTYAAGYDPQAFVQFFESLDARQKEKLPGLFKLLFTSHEMTEDRIKRAQVTITSLLPDKPDYVIDTSEFRQIQGRLFELTDSCRYANGRPVLLGAGKKCAAPGDKDEKPKLRRKIGQVEPQGPKP